MTGADLLRRIVAVMGDCHESWLDGFTAPQLVQIFTMHQRCDWDYYPDQWTDAQVQAALSGVAPRWDDEGRPL